METKKEKKEKKKEVWVRVGLFEIQGRNGTFTVELPTQSKITFFKTINEEGEEVIRIKNLSKNELIIPTELEHGEQLQS